MSEVYVEAPVTAVTAFEDRATLTRVVEVSLPAGHGTVVLRNLTPLISDAHVKARFEGDAARVDGVRVERRWVPELTPERQRVDTLRAALAEAERSLTRKERTLARALARREVAWRTLERYARQVTRTLWTGPAPGAVEQLRQLEEAVARSDGRVDDLRAAREEAANQRDRLSRLVQDADRIIMRPVCELAVRVSSAAGGPATLVVETLVPCALWRPAHEAHLLADGTVRWTTHATVWQRTGEPWNDVTLTLSTDRPGAGAELPPLHADRLVVQPKQQRKRIQLAHREEQVAADHGEDAVPGVHDGGEPRELRAEGRVSVPSDGRPHRVLTGSFESTAETRLTALPELAGQAFLLARLRNPAPQPLLAGPVTLLRDGGHVGVGELSYVGAGETFELSFGSDDRWRVRSRRERRREERMLGGDRTHFVTFVEVDYGGAGTGEVEVVLRLPVSELEALEVKPSLEWCSEGRPAPDADGLLRLPLKLAAGERRELSVGFWLDRSGDVVLPDPW